MKKVTLLLLLFSSVCLAQMTDDEFAYNKKQALALDEQSKGESLKYFAKIEPFAKDSLWFNYGISKAYFYMIYNRLGYLKTEEAAVKKVETALTYTLKCSNGDTLQKYLLRAGFLCHEMARYYASQSNQMPDKKKEYREKQIDWLQKSVGYYDEYVVKKGKTLDFENMTDRGHPKNDLDRLKFE